MTVAAGIESVIGSAYAPTRTARDSAGRLRHRFAESVSPVFWSPAISCPWTRVQVPDLIIGTTRWPLERRALKASWSRPMK